MSIDLQSVHCKMLSLHSHFPQGEPAQGLLAASCGSEFSKRRVKAEGRYSVSGRIYRIRISVDRSTKSGTVIDITYDDIPNESRVREASLDIAKLWKCLEKTSKLPTWHCRAIFEYPPSGYNVKYELPAPIDRPVDGFSEVRGIRLVRTLEGKVLYSVIVDRPDNEEITCSVSFTMQRTKLEALADEAFLRASEIVGLLIAPETKEETKVP